MLTRELTRVLACGITAVALCFLPAASVTPAGSAGLAAAGLLAGDNTVSASAALAGSVRYHQQWVLRMLDVPPAWSISQGAHVTVAVIDTGVSPNVSDLAGSVISGSDFTGLKTRPDNPRWGEHGTWMASIIAGHGHNGGADGIIGIAPEAKILSIRVIPDSKDPGYSTYDSESEQRIQDELAAGIREAVRRHAQVISMSIGYSAPSGTVRAAIQYAYSRGTVLVASSGNSGDSGEPRAHGWAPVSFPADYPGVLSVGAVSSSGKPASFSSGNLSVQVAAPGKAVPAQGRDGRYYWVDGTSPACALVAGVAALIKSKYPAISPSRVTQALTRTARRGATGGYNVHTGFGIVDARAALIEAGRLMRARAAGSQVPPSASFGGGAGAVPAAPVAPRGVARVVLFTLLALVSLAAAVGGLVMARRSRAQGAGSGAEAGAWPGSDALARARNRTAMTAIDDYSSRVLDVVDTIPPGMVMSYGDIAGCLGAGGPRQVGRVLARYGGGVAWWRVIRADGTPPPDHHAAALTRYLAEGTPLRSVGPPVRVDMRRARWSASMSAACGVMPSDERLPACPPGPRPWPGRAAGARRGAAAGGRPQGRPAARSRRAWHGQDHDDRGRGR